MKTKLLMSCAVATALAACGTEDAAPTDTGVDVGVDAPMDSGADVAVDTAEPAPTPALAAYSGGECPTFRSGMNDIVSGEDDRAFELYFPEDERDAPLLFFWYGAGGSSQSYGWTAQIAQDHDVVVVVPRADGGSFEWPILFGNDTSTELTFFDDMVACLVERYGLDETRIYTSGFSAGAIWSTTLVMERSDVLASAALFSGGTGGGYIHDYMTPAVQTPILGLFGGESDIFGNGILDFKRAMTDLFEGLAVDGHPLIMCDHDGGHTVPSGAFDWGVEYLLAHSFGVETPYADTLPANLPDYCYFWGE